MTTLRFTTKIADVLADVTSVVLSDPDGVFGIQRTDTEATLVAADTAMTWVSTGTYEYDFDEVASFTGIEYRFYVKWVYAGETHYVENIYTSTGEAVVTTDGTTLRFTTRVDDTLTDMTSVVLSDSDATFGIQRTDTEATIIAANTAMTWVSTGVYEYNFESAINNVEYKFYVKWVYAGETYYVENTYTATEGTSVVSDGRTMPSEIVWKYMVDLANLFTNPADDDDWPLFVGMMPDGNDVANECGAVYNTAGYVEGKNMRSEIDQHFGIQVRVRSFSESDGYDQMVAVEKGLIDVYNQDVTFTSGETWKINNFYQTSPIISLGVDDRRRFNFTLNYALSMTLQ